MKENIQIGNYKLSIENSLGEGVSFMQPPEETIGVVYYVKGSTQVKINENKKAHVFNKTDGAMSSFYIHKDNLVTQEQKSKTLKKISLFFSQDTFSELIKKDEDLLKNHHLKNLLNPQDYYVQGWSGKTSVSSRILLENIYKTPYEGTVKNLFIEAQITSLLADYLHLTQKVKPTNNLKNIESLHYAKEVLLQQMDAPPSLTELSKIAGMNTYSLKTGFKELFGMPVYKYLQNKRLSKAHELLENKKMTVQEVAWHVGYNSIGSFSNAFKEKFGFRPSDLSD